MQLGILLAIVASIMISENAPAEPVGGVPLRLLIVLATSMSAVLLATWGSLTISRVIRTEPSDHQNWLRWFGRLQQGHLALWLVTVVVVTYGLHWPQVVRFNWGLDQVFVIRDLLVLAPIWIPLLCSWAAFYEVERAANGQAQQDVGNEPHDTTGRGQYVWLRARHYLGMCLLPVLVLLAFQDVVTLVTPSWQESEFGWLLYLIPLVGVTVAFPLLLSRIWQTTPLPAGPLRMQLEQLANRMGVRTRDFRIWQTNRQLLNAAVTGLLPSLRYVFITDGLLGVLRHNEAESVIAHELGHIRRRHLWFRLLLLALPIWIMGNMQAFAPEVCEQCSRWLTGICGGQTIANAMVIPALTIAYTLFALGRYSRLLEHDADLCVYEDGQAEAFCTTLDRLSYLSSDRRQRRTWLHPSTVARIHLLQRALHNPAVAKQFRRHVDRFNLALIALWCLIPLLLMFEA